MNLVTDQWLPVLYRDGSSEKISLAQLTRQQPENPIIRLNFHRPDFNAFGTQFLIGLVQSSLVPQTLRDINELLQNPPTEETWLSAIDTKAFNLDGDRHRFMQDSSVSFYKPEKHLTSISYLLFGSPGKSTVKAGRDWFFKGNDIKCLCPSCAAIALYIRQTNAFSAGPGYFTAYRSGDSGAVTTILTGETLWETILLNVLPVSELPGDYSKPLYPWIADDLPPNIIPEDVHPSHYFWEMPANIYLSFSKMHEHCSVCNEEITYGAYNLYTRNNGRKATKLSYSYSPYTLFEEKDKKTKEISYVKRYERCSETFSEFLKGRMLFTKEIPMIFKHLYSYENDRPAETVRYFFEKRPGYKAGLWVFGLNYNKSSYMGWVETHLVNIPETFPDMHKVITLTVTMAESLHKVITRVLKINTEATRGKERRFQDPMFEYFRIVEPLFLSTVFKKDITGFVDELLKKITTVYGMFTIGSDSLDVARGHKSLVAYLNTTLKELDLEIIPEDHYHGRLPKKVKPLHFSKELRIEIIKWWSRTKRNPRVKQQLILCACMEELRRSFAGSRLVEILKDYFAERDLEDMHVERLLKAAQLSMFIKEHDWDLKFLKEVEESKDTRIKDLYHISDPVQDWAKLYQMLSILEKLSVPDFIETIVLWKQKLRNFNRKAPL